MKYYFSCPDCGNDETFITPKESANSLGFILFIFGGFIPYLLYADSTNSRIQCPKCKLIFRQPPLPRTSLSRFSTWLICIIFIFVITFFVLRFLDGSNSIISESTAIDITESFIIENSRVLSLVIPAIFGLILLYCIIGSFVSNWRAHRELKKKFKTKPEESHAIVSSEKEINEDLPETVKNS
jgi:hypothetical protein